MTTTNFKKRTGWVLIYDTDENQIDIDLTQQLIVKTAEYMEHFFGSSIPNVLEIHIDLQRNSPFNWANEPKIALTCRPTIWSQLIYQFTHEYCHRLISSPALNSLWLEEVICECASRFFLKKLGHANLKNKWLKEYQFNFIKYSNDRSNTQLESAWNLQKLIYTNSIEMLNSENTASERPHLNFTSSKIMPIFNSHPDLWSDVIDLKEFSDEKSIKENINCWQTKNPNTKELLNKLIQIY